MRTKIKRIEFEFDLDIWLIDELDVGNYIILLVSFFENENLFISKKKIYFDSLYYTKKDIHFIYTHK